MTVARTQHAAARLQSGKVLVVGGNSSKSAELYDPGTNSFTATGSISNTRIWFTASLLGSGKVLVSGGGNPTAELYDPNSGAFTVTGPMTTAPSRWQHTASLLGSGKVLVAGGNFGGASELYDPLTATFTPVGYFTASVHRYAAASVLASGKVLIMGGYSSDVGDTTAVAELFDFVANGGTCTMGGECKTGVCDDGICCMAACNPSTCMKCVAGTGACAAVTGADDPNTCTGTSTCDVAGACKKKIGQPCPGGNADCANNICADGFCCNTTCSGSCDVCAQALGATANGQCTLVVAGSAGSPLCSPFLCDGVNTACSATCASDADCAASAYCTANGICMPRKSQGAACNQAAGADCKVAGCHDCGSGFCADGVCCDTAGTGAGSFCQACAAALKQSGAADGTCGPAKDDTNPHSDACPIDPGFPASCKADGMCNGNGACRQFAPPSVACGPATCANGAANGSYCNGAGTCLPSSADCAPYACTGGACATSCTVMSDCAPGAFCTANQTRVSPLCGDETTELCRTAPPPGVKTPGSTLRSPLRGLASALYRSTKMSTLVRPRGGLCT